MAHGGYGKRRVPEANNNRNRRPTKSSLGVDKKNKSKPKAKAKAVSIKNQIRSVERMLRKDLLPEIREVQKQKLDELKKQQELQNRLALERKIFLRNRKVKFFDRRKIERRIRRLEKQQRTSSGKAQETEIAEQLAKLKEDLEYVRFFPKTEKYVPLFSGGDEQDIVDKRCKLREQIKANIVAAAASGKDLEETGSEDDGLLDLSDDDFFEGGSSSDDADDEWTDKSAREQASSASGKAASSMSSDEKNLKQVSARALMPPPRPSSKSFSHSANKKSRFGGCTSKKSSFRDVSTSSNTSDSINRSTFRKGRPADSLTGNSGNISSNSDARKPKRKRRPKKKKQQA
ncbi:rRNA-processing protein EFG1-like [Lycium barbarum]|uniref:rRNA-processing protein EFG1-like n=1 Tax=Lycium barbarum TaxID=112863 RepID=UPI00293F5FCC|nr:rRNA-processing protein EFG1-like [Lycium barbarum]